VRLACIVVGVEVTEVLQLCKSLMLGTLQLGGVRCNDTFSSAGGAFRLKTCSLGERVEGGPEADRSEPRPKRNVPTQRTKLGLHRSWHRLLCCGFNRRMFQEVAHLLDAPDLVDRSRQTVVVH